MNAVAPIASAHAQALAAALPPDDLAEPRASSANTAASAPGAFAQLVADGLQSVNRTLLVSQRDLQALASGRVENLHEVMIHLEEAQLSFQLMMQVRGRLLEAYQDVMKMQV